MRLILPPKYVSYRPCHGGLCEADDVYRWLYGGVRVSHHTLPDFRVGQGVFLDKLLTANVASLLACGAVTMQRVAQDGMRVRAHAGAASFRRKAKLQHFHEQARQQVEALKREVSDVRTRPIAGSRRRASASSGSPQRWRSCPG